MPARTLVPDFGRSKYGPEAQGPQQRQNAQTTQQQQRQNAQTTQQQDGGACEAGEPDLGKQQMPGGQQSDLQCLAEGQAGGHERAPLCDGQQQGAGGGNVNEGRHQDVCLLEPSGAWLHFGATVSPRYVCMLGAVWGVYVS